MRPSASAVILCAFLSIKGVFHGVCVTVFVDVWSSSEGRRRRLVVLVVLSGEGNWTARGMKGGHIVILSFGPSECCIVYMYPLIDY